MDIGVCVASRVDDIDYVVRAEELGFSDAWFADSHMIWSDPYACLALAADRTNRIGLGTGVAVAATRPAPVTAASMATINQLAPGRVFCGIGTGNTAVRIMGHKPMTIAASGVQRIDGVRSSEHDELKAQGRRASAYPLGPFDDYLTEFAPLLRGDEAMTTWNGVTAPVRHIMADRGFVNFADPIPLLVSGFGPRSLALAGKHGDGAVLSIPPRSEAMERVWGPLERGAAEVGRSIDRNAFHTTTLTTIVVTEPGEALDSERVRRESGAFAIASLHYSYDQWRNYGRRPSNPAVLEVWDDYTALLDTYPVDRRHQRVHAGHNCWVLPEEQQFVTADLIAATCLVGTADDLVDRLRALEAAGLDQVMILPPLDVRYDVLKAVGSRLIPRLRAGRRER